MASENIIQEIDMNNSEKLEFLMEHDRENTIYKAEAWKEKLPKKLYRYRPLGQADKDNNEFEALKNDKVWCSVIDKLDDKQEMKHSHTRIARGKELIDYLGKREKDDFIEIVIQEKLNADAIIKRYFNIEGEIPHNYIGIRNKLAERLDIIPRNRETFRNLGKKAFREILLNSNIIEILENGDGECWRENLLLTCFSDDGNSDSMWDKYAGKREGFCAVYDFEKMLENKVYTLPVHYTYKNIVFDHNNMNKALCLKYPEFEFESEWRMININEEANVNGKLASIIMPEEIICGRMISSENEEKLREICDNKGIKLSKK